MRRTENGQSRTEKRQTRTTGHPDNLARARTHSVCDVRLSARTKPEADTDKTAGQMELETPSAEHRTPLHCVPGVSGVRSREGEKQRFAADPRFAGWIAGMPEVA